jgi:hypothetical protein
VDGQQSRGGAGKAAHKRLSSVRATRAVSTGARAVAPPGAIWLELPPETTSITTKNKRSNSYRSHYHHMSVKMRSLRRTLFEINRDSGTRKKGVSTATPILPVVPASIMTPSPPPPHLLLCRDISTSTRLYLCLSYLLLSMILPTHTPHHVESPCVMQQPGVCIYIFIRVHPHWAKGVSYTDTDTDTPTPTPTHTQHSCVRVWLRCIRSDKKFTIIKAVENLKFRVWIFVRTERADASAVVPEA